MPTLSAVLEILLPLTCSLQLSLGMLNSEHFAPESKNEDLHAGLLQLPQKTVLLVTEAGVSTGKLDERGPNICSFCPSGCANLTRDYRRHYEHPCFAGGHILTDTSI